MPNKKKDKKSKEKKKPAEKSASRKSISRKRDKAGAGAKKRERKKITRVPIKKELWLEKFEYNPIVEPQDNNGWESQYTFNPAALYENNLVHLIYRAIGDEGISVFGYAASKNGLFIDERLDSPVYAPKDLFEKKGKETVIVYSSNSGGSWEGCEDPRLTKIGDRIYMTYTAFENYPRVAITSIKTDDFLSRKWRWKEPVIISPPGEVHKNWVVFPEKIKGQYAILHGISPDILVDYFDSLDFDGKTFIKSSAPNGGSRKGQWDSRVRGIGPPPIKTKDGWLVIYHAISEADPGKYKMGAMILDYSEPTKILYRSAVPILEPDEKYEYEGFKGGIVYSCGAVVKDGQLFVYYGAADTVTCVATANLEKFLENLKKNGVAKIRKAGTISRRNRR